MKYWLFDKDPFDGLLQFFREMVVVSWLDPDFMAYQKIPDYN